jgi:hypothetical protein
MHLIASNSLVKPMNTRWCPVFLAACLFFGPGRIAAQEIAQPQPVPLGSPAPSTPRQTSPQNLATTAPLERIETTDGITVEGRIISENPEEVVIQTRIGTFTYQRVDIRQIIRPTPVPPQTPAPQVTPFFNIQATLPSGPLDPLAPPRVPPVYQFALMAFRRVMASMTPQPTQDEAGIQTPSAASSPDPTDPQ